jgi:hypothetical protein
MFVIENKNINDICIYVCDLLVQRDGLVWVDYSGFELQEKWMLYGLNRTKIKLIPQLLI